MLAQGTDLQWYRMMQCLHVYRLQPIVNITKAKQAGKRQPVLLRVEFRQTGILDFPGNNKIVKGWISREDLE